MREVAKENEENFLEGKIESSSLKFEARKAGRFKF